MVQDRKIIVSVSISQSALDKIDSITYKDNKSRAEIIRQAVDDYLLKK